MTVEREEYQGPPSRCITTGDPVTLCAHSDLHAEVERLRSERQAVLDVVNLYGDDLLHRALDDIGWVPRVPR